MSDIGAELAATGGEPQYIYDESSGVFWMTRPDGSWISMREGALRRELMKRGLSHKIDPAVGKISPLDARIREIEQGQRVEWSGELAGFRQGIHVINGVRCLVSKELQLVQPVRGEWPVIRQIIDTALLPAEGESPDLVDQRDILFTWAKHWLSSLHRHQINRGPVLALAGPPGALKTRIATIFKELAGGRVSKVYDYLVGREDFNRKMLAASLQLVDDEIADTSRDARAMFAHKGIKGLTANDQLTVRAMHKDGVDLDACIRLMVLLNNEGESLLVLPTMERSTRDKVDLLLCRSRKRPEAGSEAERAGCWPAPMPTRTPEEQVAFWSAVRAELPAFAFFLLEEYVAPTWATQGRFGVTAWQHPELLRELQQFSKHVRLWQLIEQSGTVWREVKHADTNDAPQESVGRDVWEGTTMQLHDLLVGEASMLSPEDRRAVPSVSWMGQHLKAAADEWGDEVVRYTRARDEAGVVRRRWRLARRPELAL